jgi:hypothetical protein
MSMAAFVWSGFNRVIYVLSTSQRFFLCQQLCVALCVMVVATFPFRFPLSCSMYISPEALDKQNQVSDEISTRGLDVACMANVWLLVVGIFGASIQDMAPQSTHER